MTLRFRCVIACTSWFLAWPGASFAQGEPPKDAPSVETLKGWIDQLGAEDVVHVREPIESLVTWYPKAQVHVLRALRDERELVRWRCLTIVDRCGDTSSLDRIRTMATGDRSPRVRMAALQFVQEHAPEPFPALLREVASNESDPANLATVFHLVASAGDERAVPILVDRVRSLVDDKMRALGICALVRITKLPPESSLEDFSAWWGARATGGSD